MFKTIKFLTKSKIAKFNPQSLILARDYFGFSNTFVKQSQKYFTLDNKQNSFSRVEDKRRDRDHSINNVNF
jgi:hypothetical protein